MVTCPSGGVPKAGIPDKILIDPTYAASLVPVAGTWIIPFLPYIPPVVLDMSDFCALDAPAFPSLDADDLLNLISPNRVTLAALAGQKLAQAVHHFLWYAACECNPPDVTPSLPTPPSSPTGTPQLNPTNIVSVTAGSPCKTFSSGVVNITGTQSFNRSGPQYDNLIPSVYRIVVTGSVVTAPGQNVTIQVQQDRLWSIPTSVVATDAFLVGPTQTKEVIAALDRRTQAINVVVSGTGGAGTTGVSFDMEIYCEQLAPGVVTTPQTDPLLRPTLQSISDLVRLIQRQAVPFAYLTSTTHAGLSGSGELAVQGLIGVKIEPASIPAWASTNVGDPDTLWLDSWINWGNADGWAPREFLRSSPHVSLPARAGQYTKLGYTLAPGLSVTITELVREP